MPLALDASCLATFCVLTRSPEKGDLLPRFFNKLAPLVSLLIYGLISVVAVCCDVTTLVILKELAGLNYLIASAFGIAIGLSVQYLLAVRFVFDPGWLNSKSVEFSIFACLGGTAALLGLSIIVVCKEFLGVNYFISKMVSISVTFFVGYFLKKTVLFSGRPRVIGSKPHTESQGP